VCTSALKVSCVLVLQDNKLYWYVYMSPGLCYNVPPSR